MKQASNKSKQQKATKGNDTPIGAMSVVAILKELSGADKKTFYEKINKVFNPEAIRFYTVSIANQNTLLKLFETHYLSVDTYLSNIQDNLINYLQNAGKQSAAKASPSVFGGFLKKDKGGGIDVLLMEISGFVQAVIAMQASTMKLLSKIYTYLPELKTPVNQKSIKAFSQSTKEYIEFLNTLGKLNKVISKDFVKRFTSLTDQYIKFIDRKNTSALIVIGVQLTRFARVLTIVSFALKKTRRIFRSLTMTLLILALALVAPPFTIAITTLFAVTFKLQATFNPRFAFAFTKSINSVRNALLAIVVTMYLMSKVNIQDFYKVIGCLIVLAGVIKLLTKAQGRDRKGGVGKITNKVFNGDNSGNTNISGLGGLAFGLAAIILVLNYVKTINWEAVGAIVAFLLAMIGLMIFASKKGVNWGPSFYNKRIQKSGGSLFDGLFKLSLGIAILLLCVEASGEVNWAAAGFILAFIAAIGITLFLVGKLTGESRFGGHFKGIFGFAMGITVLLLCAEAVGEIDWKVAAQLIFFIAAVSFALHAPELIMKFVGGPKAAFRGSGGKMSGMFGFAVGLVIILLAIQFIGDIDWKNAFIIINFILALAFVIAVANKKNSSKTTDTLKKPQSGIWRIIAAFAATALVLTIATLLINPGKALAIAILVPAIIMAVTYAMKFAQEKIGRIQDKTWNRLAVNIGIFIVMGVAAVFTLSYVGNVVKAFGSAIIMFGIIFGTIYAMKFAHKNKKEIESSTVWLLPFIGFIATGVAASMLISLINPKWESLLFFGLALAGCLGLAFLAGKFDKHIKKGTWILIEISIAIVIAAYGVKKIMEIQFNLEGALTFVISIIVIAAICAVLGIPAVAVLVALGAAVLIVVSLAMLISAFFISLICSMDYDTTNIANLSDAISIIAKAYAVNLGWIILGLIGAVLFIPIAIVSLITGVLMFLISIMPYNSENVNLMSECIKSLALAYGENTGWIILGLIGAVLFTVIVIVSLITAVVLFLLSLIKPKKANVDNFGECLVALVSAFNKIGVWQSLKAAVKAVALLPVAICALIVAIALRVISALNIDEKKIDQFGIILDKFVTTFCDVIDKNGKKIKDNAEAFKVVADMANAAKNIVDVMDALVNMTVAEWTYNEKTHQLEMTGKRQINDEDFNLVSRNMGKMMGALIAPLAVIASDDAEWDFGGGVKVKNPFDKSKGFFGVGDMSGVMRLKMIGDAFEKIPAIVQGFCDNPLLTDTSEEGSAKMEKLQTNIGIFFDTIIECMNKLPQKSVLDTWFDGTASWLKDTVQPVFTTSNEIMLSISKGIFWKVPSISATMGRIKTFWSETDLILGYVEQAKKKKFDDKFATKVINFYNALDELNTNSWLNLTNMDSTVKVANASKTLVNALADSKSFNNINKNLQNTDKNIRSIVGNINKINISKALVLERNLKLLTDAKSQEALKNVIEELKEMIGLLKDVQEQQVKATETQTQQAQEQFNEEKALKENESKSEEQKSAELLTVLQKLNSLITGGGIHAQVDLSGISQEIEEALYNCGVGTKTGSTTGLKRPW